MIYTYFRGFLFQEKIFNPFDFSFQTENVDLKIFVLCINYTNFYFVFTSE